MTPRKDTSERMICATTGFALDKDGVEHTFRRGDQRPADDPLVKVSRWAWVPDDGSDVPNLDVVGARS